jgi:hypothetical protein
MLKRLVYLALLWMLALGSLLAQPGEAAPLPSDASVLAWEQANADGFGSTANDTILSLIEYKGQLYAGTRNTSLGGQIWRKGLDGNWSQFLSSGLGDLNNTAIPSMNVTANSLVGEYLYLGTANSVSGAEVWRTAGTTAEQINSDGFSDVHNTAARTISGISGSAAGIEYADFIQVGTENWNTGAQLWEYNGTEWITGTLDGFGDPNNGIITSACGFDTYFGTWNQVNGPQVIDYSWGYGTWTVFKDGIGDPNNWSARSLICLDDYILVGTYNQTDGAEIWRYDYSTDTWEQMVSGGFEDANNISISAMAAVGEYLYAGTENSATGAEVWRSPAHGDLGTWEQVNLDGFGDLNNSDATAIAGYGRYLVVGTRNLTSGAELWSVELNGPDRSFLVRSQDPWILNFAGAYNSHDRQYLAMWQNLNDGDYDDTLQAQRLSWSGDLIGAPFMVSSGGNPASERSCPRLAYDSLHNRYLAAWKFKETAYYDDGGVRARLLSASGGLVGNEILVDYSSASLWGCPEAGYSPGSDRYLVVYTKPPGSLSLDIYAQALLADGTLDGSAFLIEQGAAYTAEIGLAYNPARNEFLVVWMKQDSSMQIYGRRVKMSGGAAIQGEPFLISDGLDGTFNSDPAVGAISTPAGVGEYLVAWGAQTNFFGYNVKARRVTGLGIVTGDPVTLSEFHEASQPHVSGLASNARFEIVWETLGEGRYGETVIGRGLDANGSLLGPPAWLAGEKLIYSTQIYGGPYNTALVLYNDFPPDYEHWNLRGYIFGLGSYRSYIPMISK